MTPGQSCLSDSRKEVAMLADSTRYSCTLLFIFSSNTYLVFRYPASITEIAAEWLTNEAVESITQVSCSFQSF